MDLCASVVKAVVPLFLQRLFFLSGPLCLGGEITGTMMSPEDELCLLLARGRLAPGERERALALLSTPLRWDHLLARARRHQVTPLVYHNLRSLEFQGVPEPARVELRAAFRWNAAWNAFLAAELAGLLRVLDQAGVRAIPVKGVTLAESLYGDSSRRVCTDVDLLVPPVDALRARRLILAQGFASPFTEEFFLAHQFRVGDECSFHRKMQKLTCFLELHWIFLQHWSKDEEAVGEIWREARPKEFFGAPAYALSPEWEFLYLVCHAAFHRWQSLKWLADVHEACLEGAIDWVKVSQLTERFALEPLRGPRSAPAPPFSACPFRRPRCPRPAARGRTLPEARSSLPRSGNPPSFIPNSWAGRRSCAPGRKCSSCPNARTPRRFLCRPPSASFIISSGPCAWPVSGAGVSWPPDGGA